MNHSRPTLPELAEAKRLLTKAKSDSGVTSELIAYRLGTSRQYVELLIHSAGGRHMRVSELLRLSKHPETREFVRLVIAGVQANVDHQQLRVCDLDAMSTANPDTARAALATVVGRLWPQIGPVNSQIPETVEDGRDTADDAAHGVPVRSAGTIAASATRQRGSVVAGRGRGVER